METQGPEEKKSTLIRYAILKKQNKRIFISAHETNDGSIAIQITTKRLIDRKTRHIHRSKVLYGLETAVILKDIIGLLFEDPEFMMKANREMGQLEKGEKMVCTTNIVH